MSAQARPFAGGAQYLRVWENAVSKLEAKIKTHESIGNPCGVQNCIASCTLTRASRWLQKKSQPPRRLPSPATERARDLKRALTKQGQPLYPRARNLKTALKQAPPLYLGARIFKQTSSSDYKIIIWVQ